MRKRSVLLAAVLLFGAPTFAAAQQPVPLTPAQKAALKYSDAWWDKALQLERANKLDEAVTAAEKSLEFLQEVRDDLDPSVLETWKLLARLNGKREDFPAQQKALAEVLRIREKKLGRDHWQVTDARLALERSKRWAALDEGQRRKWEEAGAWIANRERFLAQGRLREAADLAAKIAQLHQEIWGEHDPETARAIAALGFLLHAQERYAEAEKPLRHALAIRRKVLGEDHPDTATTYNNLAAVLNVQGQGAEAEQLDRKALGVYLKLLGSHHLQTANSYNNLAVDLRAQGKFAEAEAWFRKAVAVVVKIRGEDDLDSAAVYNNLAANLRPQGQYAEAEQLDRKALAIRLKRHGELHAMTAISYNNLAFDRYALGQILEAEKLFRKAAAIALEVHGKEHAETAMNMGNVAASLRKLGRFAEAEDLDREVLATRIKLRGEYNPDTALSFHNLALDLRAQAKFTEAEKLARKALAVYRKLRGESHPDTANSYYTMAGFLYDVGECDKAEEMAAAGAKSFQAARLGVSFAGLERSAFSSERSPMELLACLLARNGKPARAWEALEQDLGRGLFDDLTARTARNSDTERQREQKLLAQLGDIDRRMPGLLGGKTKNIEEADKLRKERDAVMLELAEFQSQMVQNHGVLAGEVYGQTRIQKSLASDAAFLAWVDIAGHSKSKNPAGEHWACVLRAKGDPVWVRLKGANGNWEQTDDELPGKVLNAVRNAKDTAANDLLADLYQQRLEPLEPHLKAVDGLPAVKHLIVLPSAAMLGFPIESLTDRYMISYSPSATIYAYLRENRREFGKACDLLALADPAFTEEQFQGATVKDAAALAARGPEKKRLPGTKGEVEAIAKLVKARGGKVVPLLGTAANGKNLDRLAAEQKLMDFRYLHLATHGTPDAQGGMNSFLALASEDFKLLPYDKLTAGHILRTWKLDADLVTLSACETGLGQLQGGEGYVGFSQALFLAGQKGVGVRTLVMSQWQVNDLSTALLMERFYQNLLGRRKDAKEPMGKLAALTEARQYLRTLTKEEALDQLKAIGLETDPRTNEPVTLTGRRPFAHPFYWAPFIMVGDAGGAEK